MLSMDSFVTVRQDFPETIARLIPAQVRLIKPLSYHVKVSSILKNFHELLYKLQIYEYILEFEIVNKWRDESQNFKFIFVTFV